MHSRLLIGFVVAVVLTASRGAARAAEPTPIRVMSFNIRYGAANDGPNRWELRNELLAETIREFDPDLLGTQETLLFQKDYLAGQLPAHAAFGAGRDDGKLRGEMTALFYREERFERLDGGHFWLSETPDVPGSVSWDSALTRMCTWVKLRDRRSPGTPSVWFFNTHFDHRGREARTESARLLRRRIVEMCGDEPVIVTGDFNAPEGSDPYRALFETVEGTASPVRDLYRAAHPEASRNEGTFNGFDPSRTSGPRIDWIAGRGWEVRSAEIVQQNREGRTPSDHWAVTAVLVREGTR